MNRQLRLPLPRKTSYERRDFVVSAANQATVAAVEAWPAWHGGVMALCGPSGSGKSHLAFAWAKAADAIALTADASPQHLHSVRGRPVLAEDADGFGEETLFHLINMAGEPGGGLLLTARRTPALWTVSLPDLRSRLAAIGVAELGPPDDEMLRGVLRKFFRDRSIKPSDELLSYLIFRIERSVPAAKAVVARLDEAADLANRPVSRALAREVLEAGPEPGELFDTRLVETPPIGQNTPR